MREDLLLKDASIAELEEALEEALEKREFAEKPKALDIIDTSQLRTICEAHIDSVSKDEYDSEDEHVIFETAMVAVFGEDVWEWYNERV